jgi:hypothetical protein
VGGGGGVRRTVGMDDCVRIGICLFAWLFCREWKGVIKDVRNGSQEVDIVSIYSLNKICA